MASLQLSEEDLRETLRRAQEIAGQSRDPAESEPVYEGYLKAAEEVGIPREATLQALRERLLIPAETLKPGEMVFAPSVDGAWYPATLVSIGTQTATVRFVDGGDHTCALADLHALALVPGRGVQFDFGDWGWWDATVRKYDPVKGQVHVQAGAPVWETAKGPLSKVRLAPRKRAPDRRVTRLLLLTSLLSGLAGTGIGLLLGSLLR